MAAVKERALGEASSPAYTRSMGDVAAPAATGDPLGQ